MSEHRIYRFPQWNETPYKHIIRKCRTDLIIDKAEPTPQDERMEESYSRSRRLIQEYILCNPFTLFCTFTFDDTKVADRTEYRALKKKLCAAFNNYRVRHDSEFRYLIVPELHDNGAVHFHGVITTPKGLCSPLKIPKRDDNGKLLMVPNTPGYMDWPYYSEKFGFFSCSWIRDYTGCAIYVSKYMTKDLAKWFNKNDQIVLHSQGLKRPELVYCQSGGQIPGHPHERDFDGEFCAVGMRDEYDTAPYYVDWVDGFRMYPEQVTQMQPFFRELPGVYDNWEQISMILLRRANTGRCVGQHRMVKES